MQTIDSQASSKGWILFVKLSFALSLIAMAAVIILMDSNLMLKGYLALNAVFIVSSTIMMSKTLRDDFESQKIINKISEAKTNKIIQEYTE